MRTAVKLRLHLLRPHLRCHGAPPRRPRPPPPRDPWRAYGRPGDSHRPGWSSPRRHSRLAPTPSHARGHGRAPPLDCLLPPRVTKSTALQQSYLSSRWPVRRAGKLLASAHGWGHGGILPVTTVEASSRPRCGTVGPGQRPRRGKSIGAHKLLVGNRCAHDRVFGGEGVGERDIHTGAGSRPPALDEDALLQPFVTCRFGVGERYACV
jgi:hypothetical protein